MKVAPAASLMVALAGLGFTYLGIGQIIVSWHESQFTFFFFSGANRGDMMGFLWISIYIYRDMYTYI